MKSFIFAFLLLIPILLYGQLAVDMKDEPYQQGIPTINSDDINVQVENEKSDGSIIQGYTKIATIVDAYWSYYASLTTPFVYEPKSGTLIFVGHDRVAGANNTTDGSLYLIRSTNNGTTWLPKLQVYLKNQEIPVLPSVGVLNPNNSTNPNDFKYLVTAPIAVWDPVNQNYPWAGDIFVVSTPSGIDPFKFRGPNSNYRWWTSRNVTIDDGEPGFVINAGMLASEANSQYGAYGVTGMFFDTDDYDFTAQDIPSYWTTTNFRLPDVDPPDDVRNFTLNSPMSIDVDSKGNVYVAVNNFFIENPDNRVVGVGKSTDYGATWTDWDMMPASNLSDYIFNNGGLTEYTPQPYTVYQGDGFVVTGEDEYSYIYRIFFTTNGQTWDGYHIVEAYKKNNIWNMRKVSDYQGLPFVYVINDVDGNDQTLGDSLTHSQRSNEVQTAITKDRQKILVKWIQPVDKPIVINPPFQNMLKSGTTSVDTLYATDVFTTWRDVNGTTWSEPVNVTDDNDYNKMTLIPRIIPDLENVPMLSLRTVKATNPNSRLYRRNGYADYMHQLIVDSFQPQDLLFTKFNALTGATPVPEPLFTSDIALKDVFPNPVTGLAELGFKLGKPTHVRLELRNSLGELIEVLAEGIADPGTNVVNVNTSKYSSGVYYYTLIADGLKQTKILVVNN